MHRLDRSSRVNEGTVNKLFVVPESDVEDVMRRRVSGVSDTPTILPVSADHPAGANPLKDVAVVVDSTLYTTQAVRDRVDARIRER